MPSNEFIIFHGLLGLAPAGDGLIFTFLSVVWGDVQMFTLCIFLHGPYSKYITVRYSLETFLCIWEQPEKEECFLEGPGRCFGWWMVLEAV